MRTTAVSLDHEVCDQVQAGSKALGQSVSGWLNDPALIATHRQHAAVYVAWESANYRTNGFDLLDRATAAASLNGAEW
jgi:hypothetical protein